MPGKDDLVNGGGVWNEFRFQFPQIVDELVQRPKRQMLKIREELEEVQNAETQEDMLIEAWDVIQAAETLIRVIASGMDMPNSHILLSRRQALLKNAKRGYYGRCCSNCKHGEIEYGYNCECRNMDADRTQVRYALSSCKEWTPRESDAPECGECKWYKEFAGYNNEGACAFDWSSRQRYQVVQPRCEYFAVKMED